MRRRVFSILLSLLSILLIIPVFPASAATDYSAELRSKGFPESYIADLNKLKQAHPKWNFEVLTVGENFSDSVSKERKSHSQQLIQNYSGNNGKGYYCTCSKCSKSGSPIVMELPNWVSASEKCVEYYLDPRNFLDEKQIFQFESILYNANQTQTGVESILNGTWMHNANITYKDKKGNSVTYSPKTKYSKAIMDAAKNSGLSAYYLASKIVQEVGGAKATAGGASGTNKSYPGIYNYYNIGANTGAVDGLKWASQSPSGAHVQTSSGASVNLRKSPVNGSIITALPSGTKVSTYEYTSKQSDGYKWVKLTNVSIGGKKYTGYIRSDYFIKGGSDSFNRPWTNPYLTIYNGAKWIATNFEDQYTGYLQKFNVNPKSSSMHSHEYMANIQAASTESVKTYNAYKNNGALNSEITFSIPVFKNMPNEKPALTAPKLNTIKVNNDCSLSLSWNSIKNADQYEIYHKNGSTYSYYKTVKTNSATLKNAQYKKTYTYAIKAISSKGTASPSAYSNAVSVTNNLRLVAPKPTAKLNSNKTVTIEWNKISAANTYKVYSKDSVKNTWRVMTTTSNTSTTTGTAIPGVTYSYKVVADNTTSKTSIASPESSVVSVINRIELAAPKLQPIVVNHDGSFDLIWNKVEDAAEYVIYAKSGSGSYELYKTVSTNSINIPDTDYGIKYSFKIQADNEGNAYEASSYSNVVSAENDVKLKTPTLKVAVNSSGTFKFSWEKVTGADKYQIYVKNADDSYKLFKTVTGATSYTSTFKTYNKQYTYKVRAVNNKNSSATSAYSKTVNATNTKKLQAPTLKVAVNSNGTFKFSWGKITGADKYQIYVKNSDGSYKLFKTVTGATSYTSTYKTYNKQYTYKVRAVNNKNSSLTSDYSKTVNAKNTKKLAAPSNVKISANKNETFTLTWSKVSGADKYKVYILRPGEKSYTLRNTTTSNKITTGSAAKGKTYKYKIKAVKSSNSSATSAYSSVVSIKIK